MSAFRFIVDENLPPHLAYWLRDQKQEATHVDYEKLDSSPDHDIWSWAMANDAIVVSKDQDFRNRIIPGQPPRLLWIRWGNTRKQELIRRLTLLWPEILDAFENGEAMLELTDRA